MNRLKITVIGDLLVDVWWRAEPSIRNIEHAAIALVSQPESRRIKPGGAGIVIDAIRRLPVELSVYSTYGPGSDAHMMLAYLLKRNIPVTNIRLDPEFITPVKTRYLNSNGHILVRHDSERVSPTVMPFADSLETDIASSVVTLIADYAKGCINSDARKRISQVARSLKLAGAPAKIIVDTKPALIHEYHDMYAFKLNRLETAQIAGISGDLETIVRAAYSKLPPGTEFLITTDGANGVGYVRHGVYGFIQNPRAYRSGNCVGAGDIFLSGMAMGLLGPCSLLPTESGTDDMEFAMRVGLIAAGHRVRSNGKKQFDPAAILADFKRLTCRFDTNTKICHAEAELIEFVEQQRLRNKTIVFTNGCFDLLHAGHIAVLTHARNMGDIVIVAIDSDASVRELKGVTRPVQDQTTRAANVAALACVSRVYVFDSRRQDAEDGKLVDSYLYTLISNIRPDVLVKGADYSAKPIIGANLVSRVSLCPLVAGTSTTQLVDKLRQTNDSNRDG